MIIFMVAKHHDKDVTGQSPRKVGVRSSHQVRWPTISSNENRGDAVEDNSFAADVNNTEKKLPPSRASAHVMAQRTLWSSRAMRKRRGRQVIVAVIALLVGAAFIAYPFVSNAVSQSREHGIVEIAEAAVDSTDEATLAAEREKAVTYNQQLLDGRAVVTDPFDPDAERPTDEDYDNVLNLSGDGVMATINIPKIHVELPIYHTTDTDVLEHGVGHLEGTSVPIGGESTHCVLSGHTGLPSMKIFDNLDQLEVGDYFIISVLGEDHAYRVTSVEVVLPDETDSLVIEQGRDLCTLVTCTPYGVNTHRLLVHAERCELPAEWLDKGDADFPSGYTEPPDKALLPSVLLGLLLATLVIGAYVLISKLRSRGRGGSGSAPIPAGQPTPRPTGRHFVGQGPGGSTSAGPRRAVGVRPVIPRDGRRRDGRRYRG